MTLGSGIVLYDKIPKPKEELDMTVCIAAICNSGRAIIVASDRMKTAGDVTFESSQKVFGLTDSIAIMTAGDNSFASEVILKLENYVIGKEKIFSWLVQNIIDAYIKCRNEVIIEKLNSFVYAPWGLDQIEFLNIEHEISTELRSSMFLARERFLRSLPRVSVIITGIDKNGPQLYNIDDDYVSCCNQVGFSAIGSGGRHASLQFMLSRYNINLSFSDALLLTYVAKKRSQIAPGVGNDTDMFLIELQNDGNPKSGQLPEPIIAKLDKTYISIIEKEEKILLSAKKEVEIYVEKIQKAD